MPCSELFWQPFFDTFGHVLGVTLGLIPLIVIF